VYLTLRRNYYGLLNINYFLSPSRNLTTFLETGYEQIMTVGCFN